MNSFFIFRRAFFARKYALGATGFTVILRATGRICAIFNETFALTFKRSFYTSRNVNSDLITERKISLIEYLLY